MLCCQGSPGVGLLRWSDAKADLVAHPRSAGTGGCQLAAVGAFEPWSARRDARGEAVGWGATRPLTVLWAPSYPSVSGFTRPNPFPSFPSRPATTVGSCSNTS